MHDSAKNENVQLGDVQALPVDMKFADVVGFVVVESRSDVGASQTMKPNLFLSPLIKVYQQMAASRVYRVVVRK